MPAEWKLSPVRRRSQPRTVGPEPQVANDRARAYRAAGDSQLSERKDAMNRKEHWEAVYGKKRPDEVSWYQAEPTLSLKLIDQCGLRFRCMLGEQALEKTSPLFAQQRSYV